MSGRVPKPDDDKLAGTIYLLHFDVPHRHAQHYLGWCLPDEAERRVREHVQGARPGAAGGAHRSPLIAAALLHGIQIELVRTWPGTRKDERALKNRKNARFLCPRCKPDANAGAAGRMRRLRENERRRQSGLVSWSVAVPQREGSR